MNQQGGNLFFQNACIDFSATANFRGIPERVMQAARSGLVAAAVGPKEQDGTLEEHVAEWEGVGPGDVFCGNGASEVIRSLLQVRKPKKALLPAPGLEEYIRPLSMARCEIEYFYTEESNEFRVPLEDFLGRILEGTDIVFWCNPNNPAAVLYDREYLNAVLERCGQMHAVLVLDECSLDFVEDAGQFTMKAADASGSLFIVKEFTRIFAMQGIRLGYGLCTDQKLLEGMRAALLPLNRVSAMAQTAGIACTKEREFVSETVREVAKERAWLLGELEGIGMEAVKGEANFIFFKSRPGLHVFGIMHGIMLRDCASFEGMPQGYYRVAVRSHEENEKLADVLRLWQEQAG